jgi:hypothetical protein
MKFYKKFEISTKFFSFLTKKIQKIIHQRL